MYWKETRYRRAETLSNSNTNRWQLPDCGLLSGIKLDFGMQNGANLETEARRRIAQRITRVAVVSESQDVLFAVTGEELRALNYYQQRRVLPEIATLLASEAQLSTLFVPFGRYKGDKEFLLDLSICGELYLEITNDLTAAQCADGDANVDIELVEAMDVRVPPRQWIKHWEYLRQRPDGDGQDIYWQLPLGHTIKDVMLELIPDLGEDYNQLYDPLTGANHLKMTLGKDNAIVWDMRPADVALHNAIIYGRPRADGKYAVSKTTYADTTIGYVSNFVDQDLCHDGTDAVGIGNDITVGRYIKLGCGGYDDAARVKLTAAGIAYWNTLMLWDSLIPEGNDLLKLGCKECANNTPAKITWSSTDKRHTAALVLGAIKPNTKCGMA